MTEPTNKDLENPGLTGSEEERLDGILSSGRFFHYSNFIVAGLTWAICTLEKRPEFQLPIGGIVLPSLNASVALYFVSVGLCLVTIQYLRMAAPWTVLDRRRTPFGWFALGTLGHASRASTIWALVPLLLVIAAISLTVEDKIGIGFLFPGILTASLPLVVGRYLALIRSRTDHRGGPATFSMWLLYWYRMVRQYIMCLACLIVGLGALPTWRPIMLQMLFAVAVIYLAMMVFRSICGAPKIYFAIDARGPKYGFVKESTHYHPRKVKDSNRASTSPHLPAS